MSRAAWFAFAAMAAALDAPSPRTGLGPWSPPRGLDLTPYPTPPKGPMTRACPKCGAAVGKDCDRRTLGRHRYHMARVTR